MVKIKNIFGDEYSGAAGKAGVFAKWKGRQYRRKYVIPANPKTTMQMTVRNHFTNAVATWHTWSSLRKKAYSYLATGLVMSGFNLLVRRYQLWKLVGKTEILDPIMGIKQIGAGDETNVPDEATFDNEPKKTSFCPVIIGSLEAGSGGTPLEVDVIVNSEMGDCMIPLDIGTDGTRTTQLHPTNTRQRRKNLHRWSLGDRGRQALLQHHPAPKSRRPRGHRRQPGAHYQNRRRPGCPLRYHDPNHNHLSCLTPGGGTKWTNPPQI